MDFDAYNEPVPVPRGGIRFPLELQPPPGFRPEDPSTWPDVVGRLEFVGGRLLFMPPCGDDQQDVASSVTMVLSRWRESHPEYRVGSNEAGMQLGGELRGADAAVWRKDALPPRSGGYRKVAPLLAVEIAGREEGEPVLTEKAGWYLEHGVSTVWLVFPQTREVLVVRSGSSVRLQADEAIPEAPELPGLAPRISEFFAQLD